jgi:hypothetical protein
MRGGDMGYYIYYRSAFGEAQIHYGDCPHCKHGYVSEKNAEKKGEWLGPFSSYHDAENAAEKNKAVVLDCEHCMP